jgi:hypothetical protein
MSGSRGLVLAVAAAALFGAACGVLGGIGVVHFVARHHPGALTRFLHGGPPPMGPREGRFGPPISRLERGLHLSETQRTRIESEVERTRVESRALRESLRVRIERELTPEQRSRFRALAPPPDEPGPEHGPWPRPDRAEPGPEGEGHR